MSQEEKEEWASVKFSGKNYEISSLGRVKNTSGRFLHGMANNGTQYYVLGGRGRSSITLPRLICQAFLRKKIDAFKNNRWCAVHMNGDRCDNTLSNLRPMLASDATRYFLREHNNNKGGDGRKKPILQIKKETGFQKQWDSSTDAANALGCDRSGIVHCANGKLRHFKGFQWEWIKTDLENETWHECKISEHNGLQWSNLGRVQTVFGVRTKGATLPSGYKTIGCKGRRIYVHRLIGREAMPDEYEGCLKFCGAPQIDHINNDRGDNRASNLRWVTAKQNCGEYRLHKKRPIVQIDKATNQVLKSWDDVNDAGTALGCKQENIGRCANKKQKTSAGFKWRWV